MKKKYAVDLAGQMAECEVNYARIMQLLPDLETVDRREFGVAAPGNTPVRLRFLVTEHCKYTTMLDISQQAVVSSTDLPESLAKSPAFSLRIYHDARMAEVVAYDHHRQIHPRYDYPNAQMFHEDEKAQLNRFLGEWLSHCLKYGHALEDLALPACYRV